MEKGKIDSSEEEPSVEGLEFYVDSFRELDSCRFIGMGSGPIPFTAILEYFKVYGVGDFEEFHYIIRRMDNAFLTCQLAREKQKQERR